MAERPPIPDDIKRIVRQRCGFGCVICGCPIYEYDHMVEWSKTHHHMADELTLLCSKHHAEKTKKLLPDAKVRAANGNPYNLVGGVSAPQSLYYSGSYFKLKLGNSVSTYSGLEDGQTFSPFAIDGHPVVSFTNHAGNIFLNVEIRNEKNETVFRVDNSELTYSVGLWDIEWVGQTLTIRERSRGILLEMEFAPPNSVSINRGSLHFNGVEVKIGSDYIYIMNNRCFMEGCQVQGFGYGFAIGNPVPKGTCGMVFTHVPRPVQDRDAAMRNLRKVIKETRERKKEKLLEDKERRLRDKNFQPMSVFGKLMLSGSPLSYAFSGVI